MEYKKLEDQYKINGLTENKLNVYGLDVLEVEGYDTLTDENKNLYKKFILNFFNGWGLEARSTIKPISFNEVEELEHIGQESSDDGYVTTLLHEIYVIRNNGSKELFKVWENKEDKLEIKDTIKNRYLRFEYEIYGKKEWLHILNENEWY
ncbi:MAG: hypothetical protein GX309_07430 [Clostridiales bacterium]|nr:hypothetical protein [Clostridiales bacterium]